MSAPALVMLLDGDCGFCQRAAAWVHARDRAGAIELLPLQHPSVAQRFPTLAPQALLEALHVVAADGRTWRGAAACGAVLRALPGWRWLAWSCALPGAEWAYAQVARRRPRACTTPPAPLSGNA